ncbi:MAG TPA: dihydrolipoamide acetyltransferase family protein [Actinomycetota bacterium]|nr:dihydrolipoamide acetyltransferase family protein [Actinomycetota bacterium]
MPEREFKLPDLGEGLTDGEVVRWLVGEGDTITLNQPIVEVETAKAVVEIPAPYAGRVTKLHAAEGASLDVGAPLLSVDTDGGAGAGAGAAAGEPGIDGFPGAAEEEPASQATLVGPGERKQVRRRKAAAPAARGGPDAAGNGQQPAARPMATPPVRKYAKEHGVDLAMLSGTGKGGRITHDDVDQALEPAAAAAPAVAPRERGEERIAVRGTRKLTAAAMVASAFSIPHVTEFLTVDATALMALRARLKALPQAEEVRLTPLAIVAKAVCVAVRQFPMMNSAWDEQAGEIVVKHYVNLGIATDTSTGLLVPNLKDADTLGILDLARELTRVTELARDRKVAPADLAGGTITVTNVGGFGVETGTPIINKPECAIVATGLIAPRPWVVDGELAVRQLMTTSVSFDHRIVDGAYAARFLAHLRDLLEDPGLLAAF